MKAAHARQVESSELNFPDIAFWGKSIERNPVMAEMTPTQGRYLAYIRDYTEGFGLPPAESEIAEALGVSPPSANQMMKTLERKGLIRRQPGVPRSIEILVNRVPSPNGKANASPARSGSGLRPSPQRAKMNRPVTTRRLFIVSKLSYKTRIR